MMHRWVVLGTAQLEAAPDSVGFFQSVADYLSEKMESVVVAAAVWLIVTAFRRMTRDAYLRRKLKSPQAAVYVFGATLLLAAFLQRSAQGLGKALYLSSLTAVTLAVSLAAGVLLVDVFLIRMRAFRFPAIIRDLLVILVFTVALVAVLGTQGVDLTAVLASAGFVGIVVGLAMQDTLGSVFSGLAIQMEKPVEVGDWVAFEGFEGRIVEVNWRSVKIETRDRDVVIIPNSVVTRASIRNYSRPSAMIRRHLDLGLPYGVPPNQARKAILETLVRIHGILSEPAPQVFLVEYASYFINYRVHYFIADFQQDEIISDEVHSKLWYALRRNGIQIPFPIQDLTIHQPVAAAQPGLKEMDDDRQSLLARIPFFAPLPTEDLHLLASRSRVMAFAAGEEVVREGDSGYSFFIVREGHAEVLADSGGPEETAIQVARFGPGDFFGEMSLMTGERRSATVRALTDTEFIVLDKDIFKAVFERHPDLVSRISEIMVRRRMQTAEGVEKHRSSDAENLREQNASLMNRIKSFFRI